MAVLGTAVSKRAKLRATGAVARAVLLGALVSIAGCIIPTPLSQQHAPMNSPPRILVPELLPNDRAFTETQSSVFQFHIAASDADLDDDLSARLLFSTDPSMVGHTDGVSDIALVGEGSSDPTVRAGDFGGTTGSAFCGSFSGLVYVTAAVSDHGFSKPDGDATPDASDLDEYLWVMTCDN
jgi:hypothetical protein